jgi:low affinity Fe/Cu permease
MTDFDPKIAEFTARGATAVLILDAQKRLCALSVEQILAKIDNAVTNDRLTPDRAVGLCHELAAFRRIVQRQEQEINQARLVAARGQNG